MIGRGSEPGAATTVALARPARERTTGRARLSGRARLLDGRGARLAVRIGAALALMLALGTGIWPATVPQASAHAVLVDSSPLDGATVPSNPGRVTLTFDESVGLIPGVDTVLSADGVRADTGSPELSADGRTITMRLRPDLPDGTYSASWRVVSADTHIVSGSVTFGIGVAPGAAPTAGPDRTAGLETIDQIGQGLGYAGLVLLIGLPAAAAWLWPWALGRRRLHWLTRTGWASLVIGTLVQLLVQGPLADDRPPSDLLHLPGLRQTLSSSFGMELVVRLAVLATIAPQLSSAVIGTLGRRRAALLAAAPAAAVLATVLLTGHAVTGTQVPLALVSTGAHLVAMTLWLGGLVCVGALVLAADAPAPDVPTLRRWSITAFGCIAVLVVSGEYQAWRQIDPPPALWSTDYGVTLLVKLAAVALVAAVAWFSQRAVRGMLARGSLLLRRAIAAEIAVAVVILGATSVLVSQPPARTSYGPPVTLTAPAGPGRLRLTVAPTLRGPQTLTIDTLDAAGNPAPAQQVDVTLSSSEVASLAVTVTPSADRTRWTSSRMTVPLPGMWTVTVTIDSGAAAAYVTSASYRVW